MLVLKTNSKTVSASAPKACPVVTVPSSKANVANFIFSPEFLFIEANKNPLALTQLIVRRFLCDYDIMGVAFDQTCVGNTRETGFGTKFIERGRACIAHARTQATDKLIYIFTKRALIRHTAFDAFRDKLSVPTLTRGITVDAIAFHCSEAAHAAILLEAATFIEHYFARRFIETCQHTAKHDSIPTR